MTTYLSPISVIPISYQLLPQKAVWNIRYNTVGSWDKGQLREFMEELHGKPVPDRTCKKWEAVCTIAKKV